MIKALAIEEAAVRQIEGLLSELPNDCLTSFDFRLRKESERFEYVEVNGIGYILAKVQSGQSSRLVILRFKTPAGVFDTIGEKDRSEAFYRILRVALSSLNASVKIPFSWKPFHWQSRISFQSNAITTGEKTRIFVDTSPEKTRHIYFYRSDDSGRVEIRDSDPDPALFSQTLANLDPAKKADPSFIDIDEIGDEKSIDIFIPSSIDVTHGYSYKQWYTSRLTREQLNFVNYSEPGPLRLRGPAGSGKTLTLVMRFLTQVYKARQFGEKMRFTFLSHSDASVENIRQYVSLIDRENVLYDQMDNIEIYVGTIYELAHEHLAYDLRGVSPISLDAVAGRIEQIEYLEMVVKDYRDSLWLGDRKQCSEEFVSLLEAPTDSLKYKGFLYDLLNEFACVIDVIGRGSPAERRGRYLKERLERRPRWMFPIRVEHDKVVIAQLHQRYTDVLANLGAVSMDQMVADYLSFLDSFVWEASRKREGFDYVYVDEVHLFNRSERMIFRALARQVDAPNVYLAYDPKQSPRDTMLKLDRGEEGDTWTATNLGEVPKMELKEVFRYTPQIAAFVSHIDEALTLGDLGEDWAIESFVSRKAPGPKPLIRTSATDTELFSSVMNEAAREAKRVGGKKVAVLCLSVEQFEKYASAAEGQRRGAYIVASRMDSQRIDLARNRFVFSMPEYVAGLQFETVLLIEANELEIMEYGTGMAARRRFLSSVLLGASRSQKNLYIYVNRSRGGAAKEIAEALEKGVVVAE